MRTNRLAILAVAVMVAVMLTAGGCGDDDDGMDAGAIDSGGGGDAGETIDAAAADAAPPVVADAGPGVACGTAACDPATQECCIEPMPGGMPTQTCNPTGTACGGSVLTCDGPEDCAMGEVCCARGNGPGGLMVEANCGGQCNMGVALCHTDPDCDMAGGERCCADPLGYMSCLAVATCP